MDSDDAGLRSDEWFGEADLGGFIHRAALRAGGFERVVGDGRPIVGVCPAWSEFVNCNMHFRALSAAVKRGVLAAGGMPLEFPTISLGESLMKPTAMLFRNLMAMDVEESIRAYPMDSVVLIGACDKTLPAQLMGAASADVPAIMLTGGPAEPTIYRGERLGSGTDLWRYADDRRAGLLSDAEWEEIEAAAGASVGHCVEMGTASTMAAIVEALGMSVPGTAAIPANDARRIAAAEATGRRAVAIAREKLRPSQILTEAAFDNAIAVWAAVGGSTNAAIHLLAIAGRAGVSLTLRRIDEVAATIPVLANVRPIGTYLFEDLYRAGGVRAVISELLPLIDGSTTTVMGSTVAEEVAHHESSDRDVIAPLAEPVAPAGGLVVVSGSLAPNGALLKSGAASPELLSHRGPAVVFQDIADLGRRIDDPGLEVGPDSVLILRNAGPRGGPGMPEWGMLPIPEKLLRAGVRDMVRISDARMSGTGFGTVVLHVAPEAAVGGPLGLVTDGDVVALDAARRTLDVEVEDRELDRRRDQWAPPEPPYRRGYGAMFLDHVLQADEGCDFDFLRGRDDGDHGAVPLGLLGGWQGGW